jgi:hypothetical protein
MSNNLVNMQAQVNQNPTVNQNPEFMSHHPPVFTHAANSLEAENWLKMVLKMLTHV